MTTTTQPRYIVNDADVYDRKTGRIAKFQNAGVAQIGADWLNGPDATPEDYVWVCSRYDWCEADHSDWTGNTDFHSKSYSRGAISLNFVLDDTPNAKTRTHISWAAHFEAVYTPDELGQLNEVAAALIVGKAEFEKFTAEVTA